MLRCFCNLPSMSDRSYSYKFKRLSKEVKPYKLGTSILRLGTLEVKKASEESFRRYFRRGALTIL